MRAGREEQLVWAPNEQLGCRSREASLLTNPNCLLHNFTPSTLSSCRQDREHGVPSNPILQRWGFQLLAVHFRERRVSYFSISPPISLLPFLFPFSRQYSTVSLWHESSLVTWKYTSPITSAIQYFVHKITEEKSSCISSVQPLALTRPVVNTCMQVLQTFEDVNCSLSLLTCSNAAHHPKHAFSNMPEPAMLPPEALFS